MFTIQHSIETAIAVATVTASCMIALSGCSTAPKTSGERSVLRSDAESTIDRFIARDHTMNEFFDNAFAYAVFPEITKGGALVGGAHGRGVVYQGGNVVGYCDLSQASIGAQLGGQMYSEVIFFESEGPLRELKAGDFEFAAQASAVAAERGASSDADYDHGVIVFTMGNRGLMAEASVGGQKFRYIPASAYNE